MKPPIRIAVLECDNPIDPIRDRYGGYGDIFITLLRAGADALNKPDVISSNKGFNVSIFNVKDNPEDYPEDSEIDAILMTGSRFNSFDDDPWIVKLVKYVQRLLGQDRIRIIGVCFGHQIVGRALGVKVARNNRAWEVSVTLVKLSEKGKALFKKDMLSIHQMHRDIVYEHPEGVEPLGSSPVCEVQGMYIKGKLITVQGHPEYNEQILRELLVARNKQGIIDDETYESGIDRVTNQHDGVIVAQAFFRFLLED